MVNNHGDRFAPLFLKLMGPLPNGRNLWLYKRGMIQKNTDFHWDDPPSGPKFGTAIIFQPIHFAGLELGGRRAPGFQFPEWCFLFPRFYFPGFGFSVPVVFPVPVGVFSSHHLGFVVPVMVFSVTSWVFWVPTLVFVVPAGVSGSQAALEGWTGWRWLLPPPKGGNQKHRV